MQQTTFFHTTEQVIKEGTHSSFLIEPLLPSFGQTFGNALRRTLLSSLPGYALVGVQFDGVEHFFTTVPGVKESILDIVLNLKQTRFILSREDQEEAAVSLHASGTGIVLAQALSGEVKVVNTDLAIAELTQSSAKLHFEGIVKRGFGYMPAEDINDLPTGFVAIDASFSPVRHVNFTVEDARVGKKSNHDKLTLEIITDGTMTPTDALSYASRLLSAQFGHLLSGKDVQTESKADEITKKIKDKDDRISKVQETIIDELNLPSRVINALLREGIETVSDLLNRSKTELVELKGVGKKSLDLIEEELQKMGLQLQ